MPLTMTDAVNTIVDQAVLLTKQADRITALEARLIELLEPTRPDVPDDAQPKASIDAERSP